MAKEVMVILDDGDSDINTSHGTLRVRRSSIVSSDGSGCEITEVPRDKNIATYYNKKRNTTEVIYIARK